MGAVWQRSAMRAYIDESGRVATPGLYVLAAVVVRVEQAESVREVLRAQVRHPGRPFHFRLEEHTDQERLAKTVGALDLVSVVAVATPVDKHRPERARKLCLTQLLWELQRRSIRDVLFESRRPRPGQGGPEAHRCGRAVPAPRARLGLRVRTSRRRAAALAT